MTVDDLKELFGVRDDQDLCPILDRKKAAVSAWRKTGVPASIEREAMRKAEKGSKEEATKIEMHPDDQRRLDMLKTLDENGIKELDAHLHRLVAEKLMRELKK